LLSPTLRLRAARPFPRARAWNESAKGVYPVYQNAARSWLDGQDLYRNAAFDYRYAPAFAAALAPATWLPLKIASIFWRVLSAAAFVAALTWTIRVGIPRVMTVSRTPAGFSHHFASRAWQFEQWPGKFDFACGTTCSMAAITTGRWMLAAFSLAAAATIKVYSIAHWLPVRASFPAKTRRATGRGSRPGDRASLYLSVI